MKTLRMTGVVRLADAVRREMNRPLSPARLADLQRHVADALAKIHRILRHAYATPDALPAPSRKAYQFLASLNWSRIPTSLRAAPSAPLQTQVSWPRMNSYLENVLTKLADHQAPSAVTEIHRSLVAAHGRIEGTISRKSLSPDQLTPQARLIRGWIAFFAERRNLNDYLAAMDRATAALIPAVRRSYSAPLFIHFRPMRGIYRLRPNRDATLLSLPTPMITFDDSGFDALARRVLRIDRTARQHLHALMLSDAYQALHAQLESLAGIVQQTRGVYRDLAAAFDRVNAAYFHNRMPRPALTWSALFTGRKFGHYDFVRDTVMISRTLDHPAVDEFVLDYVLYHELLHKKHGLRFSNGRHYAHTGDFAREEKRYPRYREAETALTRLAGF